MLNQQELETFKKELQNMKLKIQNNFSNNSFEMNNLRDNQPKDEADHAAVEIEHNLGNMLMNKQSEKLKAIERSLKRMEKGIYGICDSCEEYINIERLKVKVFADYCISCKEVIEKENI